MTGGHHTTIITWVKQVGETLPDAYAPETIPGVGELDELETLYWLKKNKIWIWTAVDHFKAGILGWVVGDYSRQTLRPLWAIVQLWHCYFDVTDGWSVYPGFIPDGNQIISKIYMIRVEGENGCDLYLIEPYCVSVLAFPNAVHNFCRDSMKAILGNAFIAIKEYQMKVAPVKILGFAII